MTMSEINRNFIIRILRPENGQMKSGLVGYRTACSIIGEELFLNLIDRIMEKGTQKERCRLRRGIVVDIYSR